MDLLQEELDRIARHWNTHRIRPCRNQETPPGRPDVLYSLSQTRGAEDYKTNVDIDDVELAEHTIAESPLQFGCLKEFSEVFLLLMQENNLVTPHTVNEAEELYLKLLVLTSRFI
ncbi:hypothetical protein AC249_AIPGENE21524 [Exaiptasia diaphana]|nr:hypothetical protein AC249_AIPGENE21524 [Exaiptasia diaphana]